MLARHVVLGAVIAVLAPTTVQAQAQADVAFDWFDYRGDDAVFATPLPAGHYRNPVLAGFYPDPSVTRVGERYYLVNSTFAYFPAIPVFESTDLVHWTQIGNVVERREQLNYDGLGVSRGMFAASIRHHDGRFYVVGTSVDSGGNFIASASNPAGPWSPLTWLPSIDGIDPSLFFDTDGSAYLLNNGPPEGTPLYEGHRAIWMQRFDLATNQPTGPRKVLLNGGVDLASKPIWIEGPHLYQRDGWYYLSCAEGGTGPQHSQVVLRSRNVWGRMQRRRTIRSSPNATCRPSARTRSATQAMWIWWTRRMGNGGRCFWPAARIRASATTPGARPFCCRCNGAMAGRRFCRPASRFRITHRARAAGRHRPIKRRCRATSLGAMTSPAPRCSANGSIYVCPNRMWPTCAHAPVG